MSVRGWRLAFFWVALVPYGALSAAPPNPAAAPKPPSRPSSAAAPPAAVVAQDTPQAESAASVPRPGRVLQVSAGLLLTAGLGFGIASQSTAARADRVTSAVQSRQLHASAQLSGATSNWLYALAAAALLCGVALEVLPGSAARPLTLNF